MAIASHNGQAIFSGKVDNTGVVWVERSLRFTEAAESYKRGSVECRRYLPNLGDEFCRMKALVSPSKH